MVLRTSRKRNKTKNNKTFMILLLIILYMIAYAYAIVCAMSLFDDVDTFNASPEKTTLYILFFIVSSLTLISIPIRIIKLVNKH